MLDEAKPQPPQTSTPTDFPAWGQHQQSQTKEIINCCEAGPRQAFPAVSQRKCQLAPRCIARHLSNMKTASVQQLPQQWPKILRWVAAGEEVQVTQQDVSSKAAQSGIKIGNVFSHGKING